MKKENTFREPLFHITKRDKIPFWKSILIRIGAIAVAFVFCAIFSYFFAGVDANKLITALIDGNFGTERRMWGLGKETAILLGIALALTPAFLMRFWNIGGEGQVLVGALGSIMCIMRFGEKVSPNTLLILMLLYSILFGMIWAVIPAIFKALWNSNETLFTLMMNYIAIELTAYMIAGWAPNDNTLGELEFGHLNFFPEWPYGDEFTVISIVFVITLLLYVFLNYSKQGYEISVVGESENTAKYIGINVKKVVIRTMALSGALCGVVGFLIVAVFDHSITANTVGGQGFTAIMVSWLAKFNPITMILTAFAVVFLNRGADQLVSDLSNTKVDTFLNRGVEKLNTGETIPTGISSDFPSVIVGIILLFIVGCEFFINYQIKFKHSKRVKGAE